MEHGGLQESVIGDGLVVGKVKELFWANNLLKVLGGSYPDSRACLASYIEGAMEHRHFPNSFRTEMEQGHDRNHLTSEQPYIHMGRAVAPENGSLVYPMDNMLRGGVHCASPWNSESRANEYPSSSFSMEVSHFQPAFSGPSYVPFPQPSAAGNLYLTPENNSGHAHSNYNDRCNIHENEHGLLDSVTGSVRVPFKRKSPGISVACERGSTSRFYGAGSSSSSSELPQEKPTSNHQNIPFGQIGLPHYGGGSLSISGEDSLRNVRSRSRLDLEANPMQTHLPSYSSHHYNSTTHPSNYHGATDLTNMNSDGTTQQWNFNTLSHPAHGMIQTSAEGTNGLSNESNQLLVTGSGTQIGGCHSDTVSSRNLVSSSHYLHAPPIQGAREGRASHSQRSIPSYRAGPSYARSGHEAAPTENSLRSFSETYASGYSRPFSGGWRNSHRNGRPRIAIERFQSISSIVDSHDRIGSEDLMMMDHSSFYASSRNLLDQYRDMRLDIDNMSYEELLALGERMGNVSTGLSEDMISRCLTETLYSSDQDRGEGSCAICIEQYANEEEIGTMKNCGHEYHVRCIREWLLVKKVCPICKAPALTDSLKEE
ncbi:E3 ubiquitin-protein ligase MBR2-like isoform X1 [Camellia sinensis]|uniref:E3 ubiquitin-protein ligase MBR2-like isoform X1 n=3 Tax=Camellia sinensis TaxID=4442 RepID=UPI0010355589|nr:E3 ubiquitin-protein ligase MBR2-like isoform X1 [Camellia sinensis]XP_028089751.1 E3 ubiquitin-protein ligase MBR2-like isoform X1 [Camellia sinensis]